MWIFWHDITVTAVLELSLKTSATLVLNIFENITSYSTLEHCIFFQHFYGIKGVELFRYLWICAAPFNLLMSLVCAGDHKEGPCESWLWLQCIWWAAGEGSLCQHDPPRRTCWPGRVETIWPHPAGMFYINNSLWKQEQTYRQILILLLWGLTIFW